MKTINELLFISIMVVLSSCSSSKIVAVATQGQVSQVSFSKKINFDYVGKHIFIDVVINGETYNFLFDTGWEITSVDQRLLKVLDFQPTVKNKISGSSFEEHETQFGILAALRIGGLDFQNIGIGVEDLSFIKTENLNGKKVDGIIGTNILRKANWKIDYVEKQISFSHDLVNLKVNPNAFRINMVPRNPTGWGHNKIKIDLDNVEEYFILDTGSSGRLTANLSFLENLKPNTLNSKNVKNNSNGKEKEDKELVKISQVQIGNLDLKNIPLSLEKGVGFLIGNEFLEQFEVTIDWKNNNLYLLPNSSPSPSS